MTAPTWILLPADAPEPPPLSVVREEDGDMWVRGWSTDGKDSIWWCIGGATGQRGSVSGDDSDWEDLGRPLDLLVAHAEPDPYEVRRDALNAAAHLAARLPEQASWSETVTGVAEVFERHLTRDA